MVSRERDTWSVLSSTSYSGVVKIICFSAWTRCLLCNWLGVGFLVWVVCHFGQSFNLDSVFSPLHRPPNPYLRTNDQADAFTTLWQILGPHFELGH